MYTVERSLLLYLSQIKWYIFYCKGYYCSSLHFYTSSLIIFFILFLYFNNPQYSGRDLIKGKLQRKVNNMYWITTLTRKFNMELVFGFKNLDIEGAVRGKILYGPCSQYRLMILTKSIQKHIK